MSLDYPERERWLAVRETNLRALRQRAAVVWNAGTYVREANAVPGDFTGTRTQAENGRRTAFAARCNGNFGKKLAAARAVKLA